MSRMNEELLTRRVTLEEACAVFGLSRRTVQRYLADGRLKGEKVGGRWLVDAPAIRPSVTSDAPEEATTRQSDLTRQLSEVTQERDTLARQVGALTEKLEAVTGERDYLRDALAASLTLSQRLLPERAESTSQPPRWQFWRRG